MKTNCRCCGEDYKGYYKEFYGPPINADVLMCKDCYEERWPTPVEEPEIILKVLKIEPIEEITPDVYDPSGWTPSTALPPASAIKAGMTLKLSPMPLTGTLTPPSDSATLEELEPPKVPPIDSLKYVISALSKEYRVKMREITKLYVSFGDINLLIESSGIANTGIGILTVNTIYGSVDIIGHSMCKDHLLPIYEKDKEDEKLKSMTTEKLKELLKRHRGIK